MANLALTLAALTGLAGAIPSIQTHVGTSESDWRSKITNVVVLVEENRSFDTFAGGLSYNSTIDGLLHHNYCNALNASDPNGMQPRSIFTCNAYSAYNAIGLVCPLYAPMSTLMMSK